MTDGTAPPAPRRPYVIAAVSIAVIALAAVAVVVLLRDRGTDNSMSGRAAAVMPFDLSKTSHTFTKTSAGGVETVVAHDPSDTRDIELIRSHLRYEAAEFRKGNFSDPAKIHGMEMPGLQELEAGATRVDVQYRDVDRGGEITYTSTEPSLIDALHAWFDRQTSDHAMPGMGG